MGHIRTQREILRHILKDKVDDVYDFFQLANGWKENFLVEVEKEFSDNQNRELARYMYSKTYATKDDFIGEFIFWVEKNRGYLLWIDELWDIEEAAECWAKDNGYGYLFED